MASIINTTVTKRLMDFWSLGDGPTNQHSIVLLRMIGLRNNLAPFSKSTPTLN